MIHVIRKRLRLVFLFIFIGTTIFFINNNEKLYTENIARITEEILVEETPITDRNDNQDILYKQNIKALIKNGPHQGQYIHLENEYSKSKAYDFKYKVGHDIFLHITDSDKELKGEIIQLKRDKYLLYLAWFFVLTLLLIGKKQGALALISLIFNTVVLYLALDIYTKDISVNLILIMSISVIIFTMSSLLIMNGFNSKTYAAIIASLLGTFSAVLIAYLVLVFTQDAGLRYESMDFLTRPYRTIFLAGVIVGSLGAVMDVAISIVASIFELHATNTHLSIKELKKSAFNIGKDIMATMTNILFFAYVSGALPMLILYLKNNSPLSFTLAMNLSLEIARAFAGGIGIVLTIPISIYITLFFLKGKLVHK